MTGKVIRNWIRHFWIAKGGAVWPLTVPVSLTWMEIGAIMMAIQETKCKFFLELGVHRGGLASLLIARSMMTDFYYMGVEIKNDIIERPVHWLNDQCARSTIKIDDVFAGSTIAYLLSVTAQFPKPLIIFCDNGDKPREYRTYAPLLEVGDFIIAHDFGTEIDESHLDVPGFVMERWKPEWLEHTRLVMMERIA